MDEGRRSALKKICFTAAGVAGGIPLLGTIRAASKALPAQHAAATQTRQLAMVVDMANMTDEIAQACIEVCHREHNVPASTNTRVSSAACGWAGTGTRIGAGKRGWASRRST